MIKNLGFKDLKDGFTLVEVVVLFVIFITVAILVIPLSIDDATKAKHVSKWKHVQSGLASVPISLMNSQNYKLRGQATLEDFIAALIKVHPLRNVSNYKVKYMNGETPEKEYLFEEIYNTDNGAAIAFKWLNNSAKGEDNKLAIIMYDINGKKGPNIWGKDVFGFDLYNNKIEPFGKSVDPITVEDDCSRQGTGLYCSFYYLQNANNNNN